MSRYRCRRAGCMRPRLARTDQRGPRPYCGMWCRLYDLAYTAFSEGGPMTGRDADTDAVLFAGILALGIADPRSKPVLKELHEIYGRP